MYNVVIFDQGARVAFVVNPNPEPGRTSSFRTWLPDLAEVGVHVVTHDAMQTPSTVLDCLACGACTGTAPGEAVRAVGFLNGRVLSHEDALTCEVRGPIPQAVFDRAVTLFLQEFGGRVVTDRRSFTLYSAEREGAGTSLPALGVIVADSTVAKYKYSAKGTLWHSEVDLVRHPNGGLEVRGDDACLANVRKAFEMCVNVAQVEAVARAKGYALRFRSVGEAAPVIVTGKGVKGAVRVQKRFHMQVST